MNVDVFGRIRPSIRGEGPSSLVIDHDNRMTSFTGSTTFTFSSLHRQDDSNVDVFRRTVDQLLELFRAGYNTCLIVTGESGSGKSYTLAGESSTTSGIVPMLLEKLFEQLQGAGKNFYDSQLGTNRVTMQMFEVYNELIKDLLVVPGISMEFLDVDETPDRGAFVRNLSSANLTTASEATSSFRQGFARRTETQTDFGPAKTHSSIIIQIDLTMKAELSMANKSRFTIVMTPGIEKLQEDSTQIRLKEGPTLSKSLVSFSQVVSSLANQPYADRVINHMDSRLTYLLKEELGGNFKTRVLMCFRPQTDNGRISAGLLLATQLAQVKNFPIINDTMAQQLLTQYRAQILNLKQQLGVEVSYGNSNQLHDIHDELKRVQTDNLQLRDKNERLHLRLEQIQSKFGTMATTKTDLSTQLLMTEEEKLRVSKTLVEMQIENNKLKEEMEASRYELTNKILQLENRLTELEIDRDKHAKAAKNYKERLTDIDKDRKDLAEEYVVLKSNFVAISDAHQREVSINDELGIELLNLANAKAILMRELDASESTTEGEIRRIREMISRYQKRPDIYATREDRRNMEQSLFNNQQRFDGEMNKMRHDHDDTQKVLEGKMGSQNRQIKQLREQIREKQKHVSELNAQLITMRNSNEHVMLQNNRLQNKLKDITDEFKSKLVKYVEDVAQFVDKELDKGKDPVKMRLHVDEMINGLRKAYKQREQQLSDAARNYKKTMEVTSRRHEELLVAYRELREQVEMRGLDEVELGPDEHRLQLVDQELQSKQQKEINRLREELSQAQTEGESMRIRKRMEDHKDKSGTSPRKSTKGKDSWSDIRRQLHEFTANTQQDLEQERADLISKNAMLDQQVQELQGYIDLHLARYKDEIFKLRQMLGIKDKGGFSTPPLRR